MITMSTSWSLGVLIGLPILGLGILLILVWIAFWWFWEDEPGPAWCGVGALLLVVGLALSPLGYYPYKAEYHQWRDKSGVVAEVSKRLVSDGNNGMNEKIVVRYENNGGEFGCEDTRCALVKKGDTLDLKCKRAWQYASVSGYDCRFISRRDS